LLGGKTSLGNCVTECFQYSNKNGREAPLFQKLQLKAMFTMSFPKCSHASCSCSYSGVMPRTPHYAFERNLLWSVIMPYNTCLFFMCPQRNLLAWAAQHISAPFNSCLPWKMKSFALSYVSPRKRIAKTQSSIWGKPSWRRQGLHEEFVLSLQEFSC